MVGDATNRSATGSQNNFDPTGKHSTGDLLSRLKTRKVLGVGETENGDVHRSKISQLLGHNEHLYMKFPKGYWAWQVAMASFMTFEGGLLYFFPHQVQRFFLPVSMVTDVAVPPILAAHQCHGAALLGFAILLWKFVDNRDRAEARATATGVAAYHFLIGWAVLIGAVRSGGVATLLQPGCYVWFGLRISLAVVSALFFKWLGSNSSVSGKST